MNPWFLTGLICASLYMAILLLKAWRSWRYAISHPEWNELDATVTIVQPILGGDPTLGESLRKNLQSSSAKTTFLWLVDEADSVGRDVTEPLALAEPHRIQILLCPACPAETNPKLFKLQQAIPHVTTEFIAVLDDDTTLVAGHLQRAMAALSDCDLYTGLPHYSTGQNVWSSLVAHFVNNNSILTYLPLLTWTGPLTINGMFYVLRTEYLRSIGGFATIQGQLCDDYAFARLVLQHQGRLKQGTTSQQLQTSISGPRHYVRQMHRWFLFANLLVLDQPIAVQLMLLILLGLPPFLLWGSLLSLSGGWIGVSILVLLFVTRHAILRTLHRKLFRDPPVFSPALSLIAEFLQPLHLGHASLTRVIIWRSRRIRVGARGTFTFLPDRSP